MNNEQQKIELIKKSFEFKNQKKYKEAIEILYKVLELDNNSDDSIEILSQMGELYILIESYDRALEKLQKALSIQPNNEKCLQQCFEIYFKTNQLNKALKLASAMCEENKTTKSYFNYLKTLIAMNKNQDAIELFNSLDELIKLDVDILYLISTIIEENKKELLLKKILKLDLANENANIELAKMEFEKGNYDKVIPYCLNIDEENALALYYLARVEAVKQNHTKAIELFLNAINIKDNNADFYTELAKSYIDISWLDEALAALKKAINISIVENKQERLDEKHFLCSWIYIKQNQNSKAILCLNSIKKESNLYLKAQILIQVINLKNSNIAKAITQLENYFNKDEKNGILLDALASCYKDLKLYKKAIETYKKALELYPNSIYYNLELIDLLIDNKNYKEALNIIENFSKKHQNCAAIYNSLARIFYRLKDYNKALDSINEYLKLDKNKAESYYFKGLILNDLLNYEEAKKSIYDAIKINPTIAKYYYQMARSYIGLNEYENALLYAKEAIEIDQNEINYKKQAYDISILLGNEEQIQNYKKQLERSEKILKLKR